MKSRRLLVQQIMRNLRFQYEYGHVRDEMFMLEMLDQRIIGIDGFKFCFLAQAKDARRRTLAEIQRRGL